MSHLNALLADLRERKLWPVAIALLAALVAVPVLLSKSASPAPKASTPSVAIPVGITSSGPAVSVESTPDQAKLTGADRDPFTQLVKKASTTKSTTVAAANNTAAAVTGAVGAVTGSTGAGGSTGLTIGTGSGSNSGGGTYTSPTPPSTTPSTPSHSAPGGLTKNQVYALGLSVTNPGNSSLSLNSQELQLRDSGFPDVGGNGTSPMLVYLGVLQGGHRALFAVMPGTALSDSGSCIPGPAFCQVISLAPGQRETVSRAGSSSAPYEFSIVKIYGVTQSSAAAAMRARNAVSTSGQRFLDNAALAAVQFFLFDSSTGTLVDQRNLTVGGN
jgi:hypothetical protein